MSNTQLNPPLSTSLPRTSMLDRASATVHTSDIEARADGHHEAQAAQGHVRTVSPDKEKAVTSNTAFPFNKTTTTRTSDTAARQAPRIPTRGTSEQGPPTATSKVGQTANVPSPLTQSKQIMFAQAKPLGVSIVSGQSGSLNASNTSSSAAEAEIATNTKPSSVPHKPSNTAEDVDIRSTTPAAAPSTKTQATFSAARASDVADVNITEEPTLRDEEKSPETASTNAGSQQRVPHRNEDGCEMSQGSHAKQDAPLVVPSRPQLVSWFNNACDVAPSWDAMLGVSYQEFLNIMRRKGWIKASDTGQQQKQQRRETPWWKTPIGDALRSTKYTFSYNAFDPAHGNAWLRRRDPELVITLDMAREWLKTHSPRFDRFVGYNIADLYALIEFQHQDVAPYHFSPQLPHLLVHPVLTQLVSSEGGLIGVDGSILRRDPIVLSPFLMLPYHMLAKSKPLSSSSPSAAAAVSSSMPPVAESHTPNRMRSPSPSEDMPSQPTRQMSSSFSSDVVHEEGRTETNNMHSNDEEDVQLITHGQDSTNQRSRSANKRVRANDEQVDEDQGENETRSGKRSRLSSTSINGGHGASAGLKSQLPLATKDQFEAWLDGLEDVSSYYDKHFTTLEADFASQTQTCLRATVGGRISEHPFIPAALAMYGLCLFTGKHGRQVFIGKVSSVSSSDNSNGAELAEHLRSTIYYLYHSLLPGFAEVAVYTMDVERMYTAMVGFFNILPHLRYVGEWGLPQSTNRLGHNMTSLRRLHPAESTIYERTKVGTVTRYTFYAEAATEWIKQCYKDLQSTDKRL